MDSPDQKLGGFEERLLTRLREVVTERAAQMPAHTAVVAEPGRLPRPRRRLALALGAAIVVPVVGVLAGPTLVGLQESPAYAVERDPDGSIRVHIRDYRDPKGLERRIESFGVKAAVDYIPWGTKCKEPRGDFVPPDRMPRAMVNWGPFYEGEKPYWKLYPQYIRPDQTFVYVVQVRQSLFGDRDVRAVIRLADGPVAPCRPVPAR